MFSRSKWLMAISLLIIASFVLASCTPTTVVQTVEVPVQTTVEVPVEVPKITRDPYEGLTAKAPGEVGGWLQTISVIEDASAEAAVSRLIVGDIDVYAFQVTNAEVARRVAESEVVDSYRSFGSYSELTFNPAGPVFTVTGKLNPFAVPEIREAMHWLLDRQYIAEELHGGMAVARWTPFNNASGDYALLADVARGLEAKYAYDMEKGRAAITAGMQELDATLVGGKWQYEGAPVEITVLIRIEDERKLIGDYVSSQLEDIGFTVVRDYKKAADASPIWYSGDPNEGLFHIYTGGWITTSVPRDLGGNFAFFHTDMGLPSPLWMNYVNTPEYYEVAQKLDTNDFATLEERRELMTKALGLAMEDNVRMFLVDRASITPKRVEVSVAADLYGGVSGAWLWPVTLQREGDIGGSMTIAMPSILTEPWNPIAGSNWIYDMMLIRATGEMAYVPDPYTGLYWPQRCERAEVFVQEGLPVGKTLDWVDLQFVPEITVPDDAWVDWDATAQRFITAAELEETPTALRKSVVYYPADLYDTVLWHDGSPFSIGDVVMGMILTFDRAKEESAVFDAAAVPAFNSFMSAFKGVRIISESPLVIETYSDVYYLDAEWNVGFWFPFYAQGEGSWHALALGLMADGEGEAVFSQAKAQELEVERLSYIAGPTVAILEGNLTEALEDGYVPYAPTFGDYVTEEEAIMRYENLQEWFRKQGHFWVGTGPYYLDRAYPVVGTVILQHNPYYPDPSDKWLRFAEPMLATVDIDGPATIAIGEAAIYNVSVTYGDNLPYPVADVVLVKYLLFDGVGNLVSVGEATAVADGQWQITLGADVTAELEAGSNRLEAIVVSKRVALPAFESISIVTQ